MSTQTIIILIAIVVIIAALAVRRGGPKVTQIDRTVHRNKADGE